MHRKTNKKPKIRFGEFDLSWYQVELKEIVERVTRKNNELVSTLPLTISAQDGLIDQNKYFNKQIASKDVSGYFLVKNGEFAYNKSYSNGYPLGAIKRLDNYEMGVLSTLYIVFKPTNVNSQFLVSYYDTNYWHKEVSSYAAEGARNHGLLNISSTDFFRTLLIIPREQKEQEKIGSFFKKLDEMIDLQQQYLDNYKQLKKVMLQRMFPKKNEKVPQISFDKYLDVWEERKLGDISKKIGSGKTPRGGNSTYVDYGVRLIRSQNIYDDHVHLNDIVFISDEVDEEMKNSRVLNNDILLNITGASIGRSAVYCDFERANVNQHVCIIRPKNGYNSKFIQLNISSNKGQKMIDLNQAGGGREGLNFQQIAKMCFEYPSLDEQEKISKLFIKIEDTINLQQQKLDSYKEFKKAMLQRMFI